MLLHTNLVQISRRGAKTKYPKVKFCKKDSSSELDNFKKKHRKYVLEYSLVFVSFQGYQTNDIYVFKYYSRPFHKTDSEKSTPL